MSPVETKLSAARAGFMPALAALLLVLSLFPAEKLFAQGKVEEQKKSLEQINRQLEEKKRELEEYRREEVRISSELSGLKKEEKKASSRRLELESGLRAARARTDEARQRYESLGKASRELSGAIHGELVMYSLQKDFYYPYYGLRDISKDMLMRSAMLKKRALLTRMTGESLRVNKDIAALQAKGKELSSSQALLVRQAAAQKTVMKAKQGQLEQARRRQASLQRELESLQSAALGLNRLVKKLQKQAPYRALDFSADLPVEAGSLSWPAEGRVISRFGREDVPGLKTWIVREGIRIATPQFAVVRPAMQGKVIYAGPFRAYGNVVIVDHEKGFFTVYGLLSRIDAAKGQSVERSSSLGLAGEDTQAMSSGKKSPGSAVYFEIRKGERAIDPLKWLPLPAVAQ